MSANPIDNWGVSRESSFRFTGLGFMTRLGVYTYHTASRASASMRIDALSIEKQVSEFRAWKDMDRHEAREYFALSMPGLLHVTAYLHEEESNGFKTGIAGLTVLNYPLFNLCYSRLVSWP
jgi:hypothetical protein